MKSPRPSFSRSVGAILRKDLLVEFRSKEILFTMGFFGLLVVLIYAFSFIRDEKVVGDVIPGVLWATIVLAGTLGLSRALDRERESDTMRALLIAPASRTALFVGKTIAIWLLLLSIVAVIVPLVMLLFSAPLLNAPFEMLVLLVAGAAGFAIVGTVFAAMLLRTRSRDVLLPVVLYPILIPMLIAATKGTSALLAESPDVGFARSMIGFIGAYDAIFVVVALWVFEAVLIE